MTREHMEAIILGHNLHPNPSILSDIEVWNLFMEWQAYS